MNILLSGGNGQLGSEFKALAYQNPEFNIDAYDHNTLDITSETELNARMAQHSCNVLINCAAFTSVDRAESEPELAFKVNRDGAGVLARAARRHGALLIHFSTYYVFDGLSSKPSIETDPVSPLGVYGRSKLEGEELIRQIDPSHLIIRTGWLYSRFGENFVKKMLTLGNERPGIEVVSDRIGSPTHAAELASAVLEILSKADSGKKYAATYHFGNEGACSWYDLAVAIMDAADLPCKVLPVESSAFPITGPRPWYSVIGSMAIKKDWGLEIKHWQSALVDMLEKYGVRPLLRA